MTRFEKNKEYYANVDWTVSTVRKEIESGLKLLSKIDNKIVTFFGSHRIKSNNKYYDQCKMVAFELGKRGYAVMSGGGPGIMQAANSGATEAGATSIGLQAKLLTAERISNNIFTHQLAFHFFFARRFLMSIKSDALIFYPGGGGTLNELFEYAMLMQTGVIDKVPIICVNRKYWRGLFDWLRNNRVKNEFSIKNSALDLLYLVDEVDEIIDIIEKNGS